MFGQVSRKDLIKMYEEQLAKYKEKANNYDNLIMQAEMMTGKENAMVVVGKGCLLASSQTWMSQLQQIEDLKDALKTAEAQRDWYKLHYATQLCEKELSDIDWNRLKDQIYKFVSTIQFQPSTNDKKRIQLKIEDDYFAIDEDELVIDTGTNIQMVSKFHNESGVETRPSIPREQFTSLLNNGFLYTSEALKERCKRDYVKQYGDECMLYKFNIDNMIACGYEIISDRK